MTRLKSILIPIGKFFLKAYLFLRRKKTYWSAAVPYFLFELGEVLKSSNQIAQTLFEFSNSTQNEFLSTLTKWIAIYLSFDIPIICNILITLLFLLLTTVKILESRGKVDVQNILNKLNESKILNDIKGSIEDLGNSMSGIETLLRDPQTPIITSEFVDREIENLLIEELNENKILLLTGISFCGKSELAKRVSIQLIDKGFQFRSKSNIKEAEDFLKSKDEKRVFLLEDPFGHDSSSERSDSWRNLEELIKNMHDSSRLIVTTRKAILLKVRDVETIEECRIEGLNWIDLTNREKNFLLTAWTVLVDKHNVSEIVSNNIRNYIEEQNDDNLIQIGQLTHLARIPNEELEGKSAEDLVFLASNDSKEIAIELSKRSSETSNILSTLSLMGSTNISISTTDLSQVVGSEPTLPGYHEGYSIRSKDVITEGEENKDKRFPKYDEILEADKQTLTNLAFFQSRGLISMGADGKFLFKHPTYWEAGRYLSTNLKIDRIQAFINSYRNILSCLNYENSISASKQLNFIFENNPSNVQQKIIEVAIEAVRKSIFPGVREVCLTFLLNHIDVLEESDQSVVLRYLKSNTLGQTISWHQGVPFHDPRGIDFFEWIQTRQNVSVDASIKERIENELEIPLQEAWYFVNALEKESEIISSTGQKYLLKFNEAFIRGKLGFVIMKGNHPSKDVLRLLFNDDHPGVIFEAIKGVFLGYSRYTDENRVEVKEILKRAFDRTHISVRAVDLMMTFGIDYGGESFDWRTIEKDESDNMWLLWSELFPVFLRSLPNNIRVSNTGRFSYTLDNAADYVSLDSAIEISTAMLEWLEKYLSWSIPDTHELSLINFLIISTNSNPERRYEIFEKLINHSDSNLAIYSISWACSLWDLLTDQEKDSIKTILNEEKRPDHRWIIATICVQRSHNKELVKEIFEDENLFDQDIDQIAESIPDPILVDIVRIIAQEYPRLLRIGIVGNNHILWNSIILHLIEHEHEGCFKTGLRHMIDNGIWGTLGAEWDQDEFYRVLQLTANKESKRELVLEVFIESYSRSVCNVDRAKEVARIIFDGFGNNISLFKSMILENINKLHTTEPGDFVRVFDWKFLTTEIIPELPFDSELLTFCMDINRSHQTFSDTESEELITKILNKYASDKFVLDLTAKVIKKLISDYSNQLPSLVLLQQAQISERPELQMLDYGVTEEGWQDSHLN